MEASRERGDGAPPPPRPGSMVGRTGPSSVIGSNEGWLRCPPEAGAGRGKSRVSSPRRSSGYPVRRLYPGTRSGGQPSFFGKRTESRADLGYGLPRSAHGSGCSVRRLSSTVQGVFHRLVVREGGTGPLVEEMAAFACAVGRRVGRPLGWAWTLSPRVGRVGFPSFWFLLWGLGWVTDQSRANIVHVCA